MPRHVCLGLLLQNEPYPTAAVFADKVKLNFEFLSPIRAQRGAVADHRRLSERSCFVLANSDLGERCTRCEGIICTDLKADPAAIRNSDAATF